ncbi:hypothetical protein HYU15_03050 [Candidatus Woesearchaeota archaeon]|nr:hypothetical protein [Candidatus Woesearchaeota archaeon]
MQCCPSDKPYYRNGGCTKCPSDKPIECGGNCYSSSDCGGQWSCANSEFKCCPSDSPYYCSRTSGCWLNQEKCDTAINCGGNWWACNCFKQDGLCDGRPVYNCNGKKWVCLSKEDKGTCYGNELRCCPQSYQYWWESDKQCHASPYQQKTCSFPDGSSAECDCNSNSQCPPDKPYCEENYPSPISDGYDACLASEPEYCGNGKCAGSENYN